MILLLTQFIHVHVTWDPNISSLTIFLVQRLGWFRYHSVFLVEEIITLPLTDAQIFKQGGEATTFQSSIPSFFVLPQWQSDLNWIWFQTWRSGFWGYNSDSTFARIFWCQHLAFCITLPHGILRWTVAVTEPFRMEKRSRNPDRYRWIGWNLDRCDRVGCYWRLGLGLT